MGCMEMLKVLKSPPQDMFKLYATVDGEFE